MPVRLRLLVPTLGLVLIAACKSDTVSGPISTPLPASLAVGDLVRVNVNGEDACTNAKYHIARVEAIGDRSMILADTLNPKGGFTAAFYQDYAAKFDTLVYPLDEGAFGAPTDIDNNGRIGIIFTRAVNELTPVNSNQYVGGFTFSRDLFPVVATARAQACAASNQGEFFYALAPDPQGTINGNRRSAGFVDSVTIPVLAHEFQHLINASRKLYVNTTADAFENTWLDEGLAHIAEELLFYRESGTAPRTNLDTPAIRARNQIRTAFNLDMIGNAGRYANYLDTTARTSPFLSDDSLSTRGAAWNWLRYLADQKASGVTRSATNDIERDGPGTVTVPGGTTGAEYYATLVNGSVIPDQTTTYGISATNVIPPLPSLSAAAGPTLSRAASLGATTPALTRDVRFEARLRAAERAIAPSRMGAAREWYRTAHRRGEVPQGGRYSLSVAPIASPDGDVWFRLVNNAAVGIANLQQVFGVDPRIALSDWSATHAVDDISTLVPDQFLQQSWNWHSIYSVLCQAGVNCPYPLRVRTMVDATTYAGSLTSGGSTHFKLAVPAAGSATITVTGASATDLRLIVVRTK